MARRPRACAPGVRVRTELCEKNANPNHLTPAPKRWHAKARHGSAGYKAKAGTESRGDGTGFSSEDVSPYRLPTERSPPCPASVTLFVCPREPDPPDAVAPNAKWPRTSASATSTAASARPYSKSASARTASCTANPAAPPATTKLQASGT